MSLLDELNDNPIEVMYSELEELKIQEIKLIIKNFTNLKDKPKGNNKDKYYLAEVEFLEDYPDLDILKGTKATFNIPKKSFTDAIKRARNIFLRSVKLEANKRYDIHTIIIRHKNNRMSIRDVYITNEEEINQRKEEVNNLSINQTSY